MVLPQRGADEHIELAVFDREAQIPNRRSRSERSSLTPVDKDPGHGQPDNTTPDQPLKRLVLTTWCPARTLQPQLERARRTHYEGAGGTSDAEYALRPTLELVELINAGDATVSEAVGTASIDIARAIDAIEQLATGGRLVRRSGNLRRPGRARRAGMRTTFSTPRGSAPAPPRTAATEAAIHPGAGISAADAVIRGSTASGRTPTSSARCRRHSMPVRSRSPSSTCRTPELAEVAEHAIAVVVRPRVHHRLAGSKRGRREARPEHDLDGRDSRLGKTFGNLIVDVAAANEKLRARVHRIVRTATRVERRRRRGPPDLGARAKVAIVSLLAEVDADTARARLRDANGNVRLALSPQKLGVEAAVVDEILVPGDVELDDGRIAQVGLASRNGRGVATPGFVDLQVNGFGGIGFLDSDAAGYRVRARPSGPASPRTSPPSSPPEEQLLAAIDEVPMNGEGPRILGIHLEAPSSRPDVSAHPPLARRDSDPVASRRLLRIGPDPTADADAGARRRR